MILPSRKATSRHKSFSINPVGPIVPVSCPPWPASITMRPIFNPSARVRVDCPSRVGGGALLGRIRSGFAFVLATVLLLVELSCLLREFLPPGPVLRVIALDGGAALDGEAPGSTPEVFSE